MCALFSLCALVQSIPSDGIDQHLVWFLPYGPPLDLEQLKQLDRLRSLNDEVRRHVARTMPVYTAQLRCWIENWAAQILGRSWSWPSVWSPLTPVAEGLRVESAGPQQSGWQQMRSERDVHAFILSLQVDQSMGGISWKVVGPGYADCSHPELVGAAARKSLDETGLN